MQVVSTPPPQQQILPPRPPLDFTAEGVTFKDAKERWVASFERDYILQLLRRHGGNISHAARDADIDRKYFRKLMKKYEIEALGAAYISMAWKDAIAFVVLILILIVRPTGLLGERVAEKI